jgi:hypothetical protein
MNRRFRSILTAAAAVGALTFMPTVLAQEPATPEAPTPKSPVRYDAFAVSPQGPAGQVNIAIERWTTDAERQGLLQVLAGASFNSGGQDKLLRALQQITPRVGFIRTPNSMGWDLKYAWRSTLPDGTRQIVIATDKPVSVLAAGVGANVTNYPFTFVEMRMGKDGKGEGKILAATAVAVQNGKLELQKYGAEPTRLTTITESQKQPKPKKPPK